MAGGKTLQRLAGSAKTGKLGLGTSVFVPGENRLAFGVFDAKNRGSFGVRAFEDAIKAAL